MDTREFLNRSAIQDKEIEELYREVASSFGLNMTEFWIIYFLANLTESLTQADLCKIIMSPKQTINSSVKVLERKMMLEIDGASGRKNKVVRLTEKGKILSKESAIPLYEEEIKTASELTEKEKEIFLKVRDKFYKGLRTKLLVKGLLGEQNDR